MGVDIALIVRTALGVVVMVALALVLLRWQRIPIGWQPVIAVVRAAVQLTAIALILRGVLAAPWTVLLFVALMLSTASLTSGGRLSQLEGGRRAAVLGVLAGGITVPLLVICGSLVELAPAPIIAISGIVIGSTMTAATLSGRHFAAAARAASGQIEAWWALGASSPVAHDQVRRTAVHEALIPGLDQTRATGLVTLPGAFVGALFGGASPWEAARFQLLVLVALLLAQTMTALVSTAVLSRSTHLPRLQADKK